MGVKRLEVFASNPSIETMTEPAELASVRISV